MNYFTRITARYPCHTLREGTISEKAIDLSLVLPSVISINTFGAPGLSPPIGVKSESLALISALSVNVGLDST